MIDRIDRRSLREYQSLDFSLDMCIEKTSDILGVSR